MTNEFADRINPRKFNFSPRFTALVGAIIGFDYGVRDRKGGKLTSISITSDGFIIAGSTAHESGAHVGDVRDLEHNLEQFTQELSAEDAKTFADLYDANVKDWRKL